MWMFNFILQEKKSKDSENIAKQEAENNAKKEKAKSEQKIIKCSNYFFLVLQDKPVKLCDIYFFF